MPNINQKVWRILESDLAIQKDISRGIINTRALARHIIDLYGLRVSLDAVISSIRRFKADGVFEAEDKKVLSIFHDASIQTKNNMAIIEADVNHIDFFQRFCKTYKGMSDVRLITGSSQLKLICEMRKVERFKQFFEKKEITHVLEHISEMSITLSEEAVHTKGILARIATEISLQNINMQEVIVCSPEIILYVKEQDTGKTHEILLALHSP